MRAQTLLLPDPSGLKVQQAQILLLQDHKVPLGRKALKACKAWPEMTVLLVPLGRKVTPVL
jgi:hypothetical protein